MRIAVIANSFQEDYINHLLNSLVNKVERVDFIGSSMYDVKKINSKVRFYKLRGDDNESATLLQKILKILRYYYGLIRYLYATDASIIHIQFLRFYVLDGIFLTLYIKALGKKSIYTAHDVLPHSENTIQNRIKFRIIYKISDCLVVHTSHIRDRIIKEFSVNPAKVHIVVHGVYKRIDNKRITREIARQYFGLSYSSIVILFFGLISEYKGLDILLNSLSKLNEYNFQLLVAGRVKTEYKTKFNELLHKYNPKNTFFILRHITDEEIEYCFKATNVTVLPYKEASQSGVLFMSYAYGIPVIGPALGGFKKDIITANTGFLFEPNNIESLTETLINFKKVWKDTNGEKSDYIKNFAISNYSWEKSSDELLRIYKFSYKY